MTTTPADDLSSLRDSILALLPPHAKPINQSGEPGLLTLEFDPGCAGHIERCWPEIFQLCEKCGCKPMLVETDTMKVVNVLDTVSAAPTYSTVNDVEVKLILTDAKAQGQQEQLEELEVVA